ncbi:hypothetical protein DNTS_035360 [Danionella cerebrum]|uniref:Uncharacterized protein n=1 Tax=Danionella cerebrum TaxID=2873325 RepID=A0A553Q1J1_9TELE|nr:hypothetical protein DNTS_035360 [Danionella translucida]
MCVFFQVCFETEAERLRAKLNVRHENERVLTHTLNAERERLTLSSQDLLMKLNSSTERNSQLKSEKAELESQLEERKDSFDKTEARVIIEGDQLHSGELFSLTSVHKEYRDDRSESCFSPNAGFQQTEELFSEKSETRTNSCEQPMYKAQSHYKQLKREHSLLLDVMLVLYRREWFLQDALPYVRRTLRKCGLRPEDMD